MSMFAVGMRVTPGNLKKRSQDFSLIMRSVLLNLIVIPLSGTILFWCLDAKSASTLGLFICLVLGGSTISLKLTASTKADLTLAVLVTAATLMLSALTAHIWFWATGSFFRSSAHLDLGALASDLAITLVLPILLGASIASWATRKNEAALGKWPDIIGKSANLLVVGAIWAARQEPRFFQMIEETEFFYLSAFFLLLTAGAPILLFPADRNRIAMVLAGLIRNTALCLVISRNAGVLVYSAAMLYSLTGVSVGICAQVTHRLWAHWKKSDDLIGVPPGERSA